MPCQNDSKREADDVFTQAVEGAVKTLNLAEEMLSKTVKGLGSDFDIGYTGTAYNLPTYYGLTGKRAEKLRDLHHIIEGLRSCIKPQPSLENALEAGLTALIASEVIEVIGHTRRIVPSTAPSLGFIQDHTLRELGVKLVSGAVVGIAVILGKAPEVETARKICEELRAKGLLCLLSGPVVEQVFKAEVKLGPDYLTVPLGDRLTSIAHAANLAVRVALSFGGVKPGEKEKVLEYVKLKVPVVVISLGPLDETTVSLGFGAIALGIPLLSDQWVPRVSDILAYEPDYGRVVDKACEIRGIKARKVDVALPIGFSPAFEGKRVRKEQMYVEFGGGRAPYFELILARGLDEVEDGKVRVIGAELDALPEGGAYPLGVLVEVAGHGMEKDYEPVLERRIHEIINYGEETWHIAQRDAGWVRITKEGFRKGFRLHHLGLMIYTALRRDYGEILDKVQVTLLSDEEKVVEMLETARRIYASRDTRLMNLTDEQVEEFYSCLLCQSFASNHVCIITPERDGLCGAQNYLDAKTGYRLQGAAGPNRLIKKGEPLNALKGEWKSVNDFVNKESHMAVPRVHLYSIIGYPTTSCGCFECISVYMPDCNGLIILSRDYPGETPLGMRFSTQAGIIRGQTPGMLGHSKRWIVSRKFFRADGGIKRIVWMPHELKGSLKQDFKRRCVEEGVPNLYDKVADETVVKTLDDLTAWIRRVHHPVLELPSLMS